MASEFIVGRNPVLEALRSEHAINKIWINEGARGGQISDIINLAKSNQVVVQKVPKKKLEHLAKTSNHQGVVASIAAYDYADLETILEQADKKGDMPFVLLLDELADPHNLGSILRTADAVGAHGVIIPKHRSSGLTATVAKASTGAIEHVPVARVTNLARTIDELKERGLWFIGTDASGKEDYRETSYDMPLGLVIGSEGKGISRLVKKKCDFLIKLPMVGHVTSLNASVAASLLMYEVFRKRQPLGE